MWQARIKEAWANAGESDRSGDAAEVVRQIDGWNRRSDADSTGALAYYAFKRSLGEDLGAQVEPPADLKDEPVLDGARARAPSGSSRNFGAVEVPYGRYFRVGRAGRRPHLAGRRRLAARRRRWRPRARSASARRPTARPMIGHGGQTSTQVIIMTDPPQSYAVIPLGESDHKESGHWDDQAEKLFSKAQAAPTYFMKRDELLKHVTSKKVLEPELVRTAAR